MTKFQEFYQNVRVCDAQTVRVEVEKMVSHVTFLNWQRGTFEPAAIYWGDINRIAESLGYSKVYTL